MPTMFELVINLKTAREIGVTIPHSVPNRAIRVIELRHTDDPAQRWGGGRTVGLTLTIPRSVLTRVTDMLTAARAERE